MDNLENTYLYADTIKLFLLLLKKFSANQKPIYCMKQHIKKLSFLFLLATLLASCDAEEMYLKESKSNNGEPVIKTLSYKEAGETFNRLKNELKIEKHLKIPETSNLQARTIKDTLGFLIETDLIKQVTLGEYKSYTMKLVKEIEGNIFFNLTIEDKNGESSMFMTCYIPSSYWVNNKDEAFQGVIVSRRMNTLTEYQEPEIFFNDIISSSINHDFGTSPGGGGSYSLQNGSPYYPMDCNGYVIVSIKLVPYPCGCENHMPWECNSCPNSPAGYDEIPYYYCQEYPNLSGDNPDNPTNPSTGGPSSPTNPNDTSIAAMIKPEECKERIVGDLNCDCQLSPYETCLLGGNSQEVCDCVKTGGKLIDCKKDECVTTINTTFVESLSIEQKAWWEDNENASERNEIENFIANSGCSEESKEFAKEAIEALKNGGEVDLAYKIIIDNTLKNNPCLNSDYTQLGKAPTFQNYLKNFDGNFSVANLKLESSITLPNNINAETSPPSNYTITITFNANNLNRLGLSIARTFVHEMIHAEIFRKLLSCANLPNLNFNNYSTEEWKNFIISLKDNYPGLYDYYLRYFFNTPSGQTLSDEQHQLMAQHYRNIIVNALKEYDNTKPESLYQALAWEGLKNTVAWNNLSTTEKNNINTIINNFNISNTNCQ